jgi:arylformamidase
VRSPGITRDGAETLIRLGVRLVGIDYLSIAPFGDPTPTHVALLSAGVVIVEVSTCEPSSRVRTTSSACPSSSPDRTGSGAAIIRRRDE